MSHKEAFLFSTTRYYHEDINKLKVTEVVCENGVWPTYLTYFASKCAWEGNELKQPSPAFNENNPPTSKYPQSSNVKSYPGRGEEDTHYGILRLYSSVKQITVNSTP